MRLIAFITGLFLTTSMMGLAQSLQVVDTKLSHVVGISDEVQTVVKLKNLSDQSVHVMVRRDDLAIGSTQKSFFCWDQDCLDADASQLTTSYLIEPGQIVETFVNVLQTGLDETYSNMKFTFYNREDPSDLVAVELNYTVKDPGSGDLMFNSNVLGISDVYPNPVSDIAFAKYVMYSEESEAKIVLHNILGSVVGEFVLNPVERELKMNVEEYKPGVYFYTLYVDNEGKITKKLIIRK